MSALVVVFLLAVTAALHAAPPPEFSVDPGPGRAWPAWDSRLVVALAPARHAAEPWTSADVVGPGEITLLGVDVPGGRPAGPVGVGREATVFPWDSPGGVPAGRYRVQALLMTNRDLWRVDAPGNWVGTAQVVELGPRREGVVRLGLGGALPPEVLPPDTAHVRFRKVRSAALSAFWGREMWVRAAVVLPAGFADEPGRRYPVVVQVDGFGSRFTRAAEWMREGSRWRAEWLAADTPRMVMVVLDGAGPLGDPYYVDSANHGPWGTALVDEVLPALEREFRGLGRAGARFTTGGSTGGWVSLALQVFHPDVFGGCWSLYPDPVDFRDFELVDVYADTNAYVDRDGRERAAARERTGRTRYTMRHEVRHENVLGLGGGYTRGGGQWGSWNAAYGPRAADGSPAALWDPRTGAIDPAVARSWERHDIVRTLASDWPALAPRLRGKLHVWVGDADEYFLDRAVRRLDAFLRAASPPAGAEIRFGRGEGHGWDPLGLVGRLKAMQAVVDATRPE